MVRTDCPHCLTRDAKMSVRRGPVNILVCECGKQWPDPQLEVAQNVTPDSEYIHS